MNRILLNFANGGAYIIDRDKHQIVKALDTYADYLDAIDVQGTFVAVSIDNPKDVREQCGKIIDALGKEH